jgi:predicted ATPase
VVYFQRAELAAAHEVASEVLRLAREAGDVPAQVTGHRAVGAVSSRLGGLAESRAHLEEGLALYDPERDRASGLAYALDSRVVCSHWLAHVLLALGYPEQARARKDEALAWARELTHPSSLAHALFCACTLYASLRRGREAEAEAEALIALATEQGFPFWSSAGTVVRGWALADGGRAEEGIAEIRRGLADYSATGAELWSPDFLALLAEAHGRAGQAAAGLSLLADALDRVERTGARWIEAELHRRRGELLLLAVPEPDQHEAETCFHRALAVAREQDARMWELRAATSLGRLWRDQGKSAEARDLLAPIHGWFSEGFDTPDLQGAKALLDGLR